MTIILRSLLLLSLVAVAGCRVAPLYNVNDATFPQPIAASSQQLSLDDYRNAIVRAGSNRGWTFEEEAVGHLVGKIAVRSKHFATIDVFFDQDQFSIAHKSSQNLNYDAGTSQIHPNYNSWIQLLEQDIQAEISRMKAS